MNRVMASICCALCVTSVLLGAEGEDDRKDLAREAEEARAEEEVERAGGLGAAVLRGKLMLTAMLEEKNPTVVGMFVVDKRAYQLKLAEGSGGLLKALQPHNGKSVALSGRLRNRGKYFVAEGIADEPVREKPKFPVRGL